LTSITQFVSTLEKRGIYLSLEDGKVLYRSSRNALTPHDREVLGSHRGDVISFLQARDAGMALRAVKGMSGPLTASVTQEMWWRFAGGPEEGKPIALNIAMARKFFDTDPIALEDAVRAIVSRHEALRTAITVRGETLMLRLLEPQSFRIEIEDLCALGEQADPEAHIRAREFCAKLIPIEGGWLTRAKIMILPGGDTAVAISASHIIADAQSRNIIYSEIEDILEGKRRPLSYITYSDYSLAERRLLTGPQGEGLIAYWRGWYAGQPTMLSPARKTPMQWGAGIRQLHNFSIPSHILKQVRAAATALGVTPFLAYLAIFSFTLARWSGLEAFPVRVLGDKRTSLELSRTVGLMFCADAVEIHLPVGKDFVDFLRDVERAYNVTLSQRIPTLHFYAPQCVLPGIEKPGYSNRIPAVFNYYSAGTAQERAVNEATTEPPDPMPWPPEIARLPPQTWSRRSAPVFLHLMDQGSKASASLHFYANVVDDAEQESFINTFFQTFSYLL
jgi:hypothetical protein